jgi:hypothetical protein
MFYSFNYFDIVYQLKRFIGATEVVKHLTVLPAVSAYRADWFWSQAILL